MKKTPLTTFIQIFNSFSQDNYTQCLQIADTFDSSTLTDNEHKNAYSFMIAYSLVSKDQNFDAALNAMQNIQPSTPVQEQTLNAFMFKSYLLCHFHRFSEVKNCLQTLNYEISKSPALKFKAYLLLGTACILEKNEEEGLKNLTLAFQHSITLEEFPEILIIEGLIFLAREWIKAKKYNDALALLERYPLTEITLPTHSLMIQCLKAIAIKESVSALDSSAPINLFTAGGEIRKTLHPLKDMTEEKWNQAYTTMGLTSLMDHQNDETTSHQLKKHF